MKPQRTNPECWMVHRKSLQIDDDMKSSKSGGKCSKLRGLRDITIYNIWLSILIFLKNQLYGDFFFGFLRSGGIWYEWELNNKKELYQILSDVIMWRNIRIFLKCAMKYVEMKRYDLLQNSSSKTGKKDKESVTNSW